MGETQFVLTILEALLDNLAAFLTDHPLVLTLVSIFIIFAISSTLYNELVVYKRLKARS